MSYHDACCYARPRLAFWTLGTSLASRFEHFDPLIEGLELVLLIDWLVVVIRNVCWGHGLAGREGDVRVSCTYIGSGIYYWGVKGVWARESGSCFWGWGTGRVHRRNAIVFIHPLCALHLWCGRFLGSKFLMLPSESEGKAVWLLLRARDCSAMLLPNAPIRTSFRACPRR